MNGRQRILGSALCLALTSVVAAAERPAKLPKLAAPVLFNTPQADQLLAALRIFPPTSPWHEDISKRPLRPESSAIIAHVGASGHLAWNLDMGFVIVPANQPKVPVQLVSYADESEPGPYPVPANAPIEGWPLSGETLEGIQANGDGDRHVIVVDPYAMRLYELYQGRRTAAGWQAACAAVFDLASNRLRPEGWTSSDAAGLPILPAIVRYDECERGLVDHALRFTVRASASAHVYPATHHAGNSKDAGSPRMGERFRLKSSVKIDGFPKHARAIAQALKTYGMLVADNGGDWRISVAPDSRIQGLEALRQLTGADFEVIVPTGENEGPRAAGDKKGGSP